MLNLLTVHNFKCFEEQSISPRPLTMLSGLNGMGKSTLVQTLLLLRQSHRNQLLQKGQLSLNGDLVRIGTGMDALYADASRDELGFTLRFDNTDVGEFRFEYDQSADVLRLVSQLPPPEFFQTSLFSDNFRYLNAERVGPRSSYGMSDFGVRSQRQIGVQGENTAHFLEEFGRSLATPETLRHPSGSNASVFSQVEAWMQEISPGVKLEVTPHSGMDFMELRVAVSSPGRVSSRAYRSTNVGFGITYVLPVITALLSAEQGAMVIIENPEAHLHPRGQVRMGELMAYAAAGGVQVITETHSDHVLNGIRLAVHSGRVKSTDVGLLYFGRAIDEHGVRSEIHSPQMDADGRIDDWPDGFFDEFERSLSQLFLPRAAE